MAPFDVMDAGRMAFVSAPVGRCGGTVAGQQAHRRHAGLIQPGTFICNELITDEPKAAEFYTQLLGVTTSTMDMGTGEYTLSTWPLVGGHPPPPPGVPNHWQAATSAVDDGISARHRGGRSPQLAGLHPGRAG